MDTLTKKRPFVIFSVYRTGCEHNLYNHALALKALQDLPVVWKEVKGVYKGIGEASLVVEIPAFYVEPEECLESIEVICKEYKQESYLYVSTAREAYLVYLATGAREYIGEFKRATKTEALEQDSYTFDIVNKGYWIAA